MLPEDPSKKITGAFDAGDFESTILPSHLPLFLAVAHVGFTPIKEKHRVSIINATSQPNFGTSTSTV